jgi:uncharacterized protein (DUF427 family)
MAIRMSDTLLGLRDELRWEPTPKRVRALAGADTVLDSRRAVLVWEPGRKVPIYAVPREDVTGDASAGRTFDDPDLAGYVAFDAGAFERWLEEDEPVMGHPRDPYARVDVRRSSRHVRVERAGQLLADSSRPMLLFETALPIRFYLPREDADMSLLTPSDRRTICPYKGVASYFSVRVDGREVPDLVWTYEDPLPDARQLAGLLCFYDERVDVTVDGERRERPG